MDQGLKERLVGAAVLVAIAVWLIPWVLDGPEAPREPNGGSLQLPAAEEPMPMRTQTLRLGDAAEPVVESPPPTAAAPPQDDPAPTAEPPAAPAAEAEAPVVAAAQPEPQRAPVVATAPAPKPPPARSAAPPASGDWIVQLGSFGEEANARRVAQRSGTFGYKVEVSTVKNGGRTLYRVRVGSARSRAEAEATVSALKAHGIDASVVAAR
ncbi:MAG TPA: SPOR domain-containing protein [Gammaproteobacteria bacterium]|nr:SPOR domain-containing protein [Gammaproteobacteria bacterium]